MTQLSIDGDDFILALQSNASDGGQFYLNTETGVVVMIYDGMVNGEDMDADEIDALIEDGPLLEIDPIRSHESFSIMEDFVDLLPAGEPKVRLHDALDGKGVFRRFKDRLFDYPDLRDEYHLFHEMAYRKMTLDWMNENEIQAKVTFRNPDAVEETGKSEADSAGGKET